MNKAIKLHNTDPESSPETKKKPISCPCSVEEVYTLGIELQYLIGDMYLNLASSTKGPLKGSLKDLAMKQLDRKAEIQKLANINLNEMLTYFYNNGGPIIEPLVSKRQAQEINGFFNRIVTNYLSQLELIINKSEFDDNLNALEEEANQILVRMLTDLANLYQDDEIRQAFKKMIQL